MAGVFCLIISSPKGSTEIFNFRKISSKSAGVPCASSEFKRLLILPRLANNSPNL